MAAVKGEGAQGRQQITGGGECAKTTQSFRRNKHKKEFTLEC